MSENINAKKSLSWFTEVILGAGVDSKETVLRQVINGDASRFNLDISDVKFETMKQLLNRLLNGKESEIAKLYVTISEGDKGKMSTKMSEIFEVNSWKCRVKAVRYFNDLNKVHFYVYINNIESGFCRFYMLKNRLYWLLNVEKFIHVKGVKIMEDAVPVVEEQALKFVENEGQKNRDIEKILEDLKKCDKVGDAGRFTESPKKGRKTKQMYHYIKGGLVINVMSVKDEEYADLNDCNIYLGTPKAKLAVLLKSAPVYECVPF